MYKSGSPVDGVYIIKSGEFELIKDVNVKRSVEGFLKRNNENLINPK
jgi:hypothetical protein